MNTTRYIRRETKGNEQPCTIYRSTGDSTYDSDDTEVGETALWLFDSSATSSIVTEGATDDTSFTALLRPERDIQSGVSIGDELVFDGHPERRYEVRTKVGVPTELDPTVWQLGVDRANG